MPARALPGATDRQLDSLLALLADHPMAIISGEKIAREIGVTRGAVWHWINRLRDVGVKVRGHAYSGYRIERMPDVLAPNLLLRQLRGSACSWRIHHFFKVDSTNRVALELGYAGEPADSVVVAEEQTAGRGRAGRHWLSERSAGIYMSLLLRPALTPVQAPMLTLAAGLAARDAIEESTGLHPDIRWPNDVLVAGKKVCGILTEMHAEPDRIRFVVVGIGVNVNQQRMADSISKLATSLRLETHRQHSRIDLCVRLLRRFESYYNQLLTEGPAPLVARFTQVSSYATGKRIRVSTAQENFAATTAGLDPAGLLRVRRDNGRTETLLAADISEAD
jgi:BirA family transcriptional regulator, biotin operon repressor / biotin---[acetyl-CoA-carboxylase] ligase